MLQTIAAVNQAVNNFIWGVPAMVCIWNEVVEDGVAFPQEELLDAEAYEAVVAAEEA